MDPLRFVRLSAPLALAVLAAPACSLIAGLGEYHHASTTGTGGTGGGAVSSSGTGGMATCAGPATGGSGGGPGTSMASEISAGERHTCAIRSDKTLHCWGSNVEGELAQPPTTSFSSVPVPVVLPDTVEHVANGGAHACAVLTGGAVYCWGLNTTGAAGKAPFGMFLPPTKVGSLQADQVLCGNDFSCARLSGTGAVSCWGNAAEGSLGSNVGTTATPTPTGITGASTMGTCSTCATACVVVGGQVTCWGGAPSYKMHIVIAGISDATFVTVGNSLDHGDAESEVVFILRSGGVLSYTRRDATGAFIPPVDYAAGISAVSAGDHVAALDDQGHLLVGDTLTSGALSALAAASPSPPGGILEIAAGRLLDCVRTGEGVYCNGEVKFGQAGTGMASEVPTATRVASCVKRVFQGPHCTTLKLVDKSFVDFGACRVFPGNGSGWRLVPTPVPALLETVELVRTGPEASPFLKEDVDHRGYVFDGDPNVGFFELDFGDKKLPTDISPADAGYADILLGFAWDFALRKDGTARLTALVGGPTLHGLFGAGPVAKGTTVVVTAAGITAASWAEHVCAWTTGGELSCWGGNSSAQVAPLGTPANVIAPTVVSIAGVTQAVVGGRHTCALAGGKVFCWGNNDRGQLGADQPIAGINGTVQIPISSNPVTQIVAGERFTCALVAADDKVYCWGDNEYANCGDGTLIWPAKVKPVTGLTPGIASLTAGMRSVCALMNNGDLRCWGHTERGQVGNGSAYLTDGWGRVVGF